MRKFIGLLFLLLSTITALATLLNLRVALILILHVADLDLHAWGIVFGRLCGVFLFGFITIKLFYLSKKRFFDATEIRNVPHNRMTTSSDSPLQQTAIENFVTRSPALLIGYWAVFAAAVTFPVLATVSIPAFQDLFQSFGADLPTLTRAVINYQFALFIFPLIALILAILISMKKTFDKRTYLNSVVSGNLAE